MAPQDLECAALVRAKRYSVYVSLPETKSLEVGLCASCWFMRKMESDRGSVFYLCQRSTTDPRFPKYPRLPVVQCSGYEPLHADAKQAT